MRRVMLVLLLTLMTWPLAGGSVNGTTATVAQARRVQADFNNDGFGDLAIGVAAESVGSIELAGAVNVLYGTAGGLTGTGSQLFTQDSPGVPDAAEPSDFLGDTLTTGDFNNDGIDDLAVGAPFEAVGPVAAAGAINVLYGSAGGLTGTGSQFFTQDSSGVAGAAEEGDLFGSALTAGDFNNDGVDDLAVGVQSEDAGGLTDAGAVNVLRGSPGGLTGTGSQLFTQDSPGVGGAAEPGDGFGFALTARDFNNNGVNDLAIGVPFEDVGSRVDAGAVNVLYGAGGGLPGAGSQTWTQDSPGVGGAAETNDVFGFALAAGDFNNNGVDDLAIGAAFEDAGGMVDAGAVNVLYGTAGGLTGTGSQLFTQDSPGVPGVAEGGDAFGFVLASATYDLNGGQDLAIGVPFEDAGGVLEVGAVNVLYGTAGGLTGTGSQLFTQDSPGVPGVGEQEDSFGFALASGRFDDDGAEDLAVGMPFEDVGGLNSAGAVNVLYGSASGLTGTGSQLFTQDSPGVPGAAEAIDFFGDALAGAPSGRTASPASASGTRSKPSGTDQR